MSCLSLKYRNIHKLPQKCFKKFLPIIKFKVLPKQTTITIKTTTATKNIPQCKLNNTATEQHANKGSGRGMG